MKTRLDELIDMHGDAIGREYYKVENVARAKVHNHHSELRHQLAAITAETDTERQAASARQAPLEAELSRLSELTVTASEKLAEQQIADFGAILPLQERASTIIRELTRSPFADRVKQWTPVPPDESP